MVCRRISPSPIEGEGISNSRCQCPDNLFSFLGSPNPRDAWRNNGESYACVSVGLYALSALVWGADDG